MPLGRPFVRLSWMACQVGPTEDSKRCLSRSLSTHTHGGAKNFSRSGLFSDLGDRIRSLHVLGQVVEQSEGTSPVKETLNSHLETLLLYVRPILCHLTCESKRLFKETQIIMNEERHLLRKWIMFMPFDRRNNIGNERASQHRVRPD